MKSDLFSKFNLDCQEFSTAADDNVAVTLETGIVTNKQIMGVMLTAAAFPSGVVLESMSWTTSSGKPQVTCQFTGDTAGIYCTFVVAWQN